MVCECGGACPSAARRCATVTAVPPYNDGWFDVEPHYRRALLTEMRRLARRAKAQWLLVTILTAAMTAGMMYKITKKPAKKK